jgi:integrase
MDNQSRWGLVARNAAALVDPPRVRRPEVQPLRRERARAFLAAGQGDRLAALSTVALALGLRQGEALGLRWQDVDLERGSSRSRASSSGSMGSWS